MEVDYVYKFAEIKRTKERRENMRKLRGFSLSPNPGFGAYKQLDVN